MELGGEEWNLFINRPAEPGLWHGPRQRTNNGNHLRNSQSVCVSLRRILRMTKKTKILNHQDAHIADRERERERIGAKSLVECFE